MNFNPQGSREPRLQLLSIRQVTDGFQSTRLSRASTTHDMPTGSGGMNFNPQGSREPRLHIPASQWRISHFNPQGSREPRQVPCCQPANSCLFQSTRLSRASTKTPVPFLMFAIFQSTRLSRASTRHSWGTGPGTIFQSTRLSRASTAKLSNNPSTSP